MRNGVRKGMGLTKVCGGRFAPRVDFQRFGMIDKPKTSDQLVVDHRGHGRLLSCMLP